MLAGRACGTVGWGRGCACTLTRPSSVLRGAGEFVQYSAEFVRHHIYDGMVQKDIILYRRIPNPHKVTVISNIESCNSCIVPNQVD